MSKIKTVLIVDDSPEWLRHHLSLFESFFNDEFEIQTAICAKEGVNKALKNTFDLIITDMEMEKELDEPYAGMWLLKNLVNRPEYKDKKFIIISSAYEIEKIAEIFNVGYIKKNTLINNPQVFKYALEEMKNEQ